MKTLKMLVVLAVVALSLSAIAGEEKFYHVWTQAEGWVKQHPDDPRAKRIKEKIVSQPQFMWLGSHVGSGFLGEVNAAREEKAYLPIVFYNIPHRDLGDFSKGGVAGVTEYGEW